MTDAALSRVTDRRAHLLALKLTALVRDHTGRADSQLTGEPFALGAALRSGDEAWVLLGGESGRDGRGVGAALIWAVRGGASALHIVAEHDASIGARRAAEFSLPVAVWEADGRELRPAVVAGVDPPAAPSPEHLRFLPDIKAAGAAPVIEHGVVAGEVRGLEVCRVVDADGPTGRIVRLEVGVGAHDREAFAIIHGDVPTHEALAGVVASVAEVRDVDSPAHPLNRLSPERFLRWRLGREPGIIGLASVEPVPPPVPRRNLKERTPCSANGHRRTASGGGAGGSGGRALVVCSVGVDLDLIPYAADARLAASAERPGEPGVQWDTGMVDVLVALPPRDHVPATVELAGLLRQPVTLLPVSTT